MNQMISHANGRKTGYFDAAVSQETAVPFYSTKSTLFSAPAGRPPPAARRSNSDCDKVDYADTL